VRLVDALRGSSTLLPSPGQFVEAVPQVTGDLPYEPERSEGTLLQIMSKDARVNALIRPQEDANCPECGASKLTA
jgi:hypothetical protein